MVTLSLKRILKEQSGIGYNSTTIIMSGKIKSRTAKGMRNSLVALGFYMINLILQFISRKVFIDYLGTEVLGLNTTIVSILQFFNLAEMGIGPAVAVTLYKPVREDDHATIREILAVQGRLYRGIALFVIAGSAVALVFFPRIFAKADVPLWYAYATYIVLLFSALLGYFFNYKQVLLSADQQDYKIQISYKLAMLIKFAAQIVAVMHFTNGYVYWLILEFVFAVIGAIWLNVVIYKSYPYLREPFKYTKGLINKHSGIITKVKQLFFHKISTYVLTQVSPLIIYAYATLSLVSIYGNYMLIITGLISLLAALSNGLNGGVGNLVAEGNHDRIMAVFRELFSVRFYMVAVVTYGFWAFADCFIKLWVGEDMLLDNTCLLLLSIILFCNLSRTIVDSFINAYGMFQDIWAPVAEASLNIGLSVLLGKYMGLQGILIGSVCSLIFMIIIWKPIFLFKYGFKESLLNYYKIFTKHMLLFVAIMFVVYILKTYILPFDSKISIAILSIISFAVISFFMQYMTEESLRNFMARFIKKKR